MDLPEGCRSKTVGLLHSFDGAEITPVKASNLEKIGNGEDPGHME